MAQVITNENITAVLSSDKPVMIDFWATWCGPCKMLSPTVDEIAEDYAEKAVIAKCNVDDADEVAMQFRVRNIPTLLFFKGGELKNRLVGVVSKKEIAEVLDSLA